jgi:hypothetical protein
LIEVIVASTIAFILVGAAAEMSSAMGRSVRKVEAQADLGVRTAIAHGFLQRELAPMAFNWNVTAVTNTSTGATTGSFGPGNCNPATNMCSLIGNDYYPIRICKSSTVSSTVCDAPSATEADAVVSFMPRDPVIEAMVIRSKSDGLAFATDCALATNPVAVKVTGTNTQAWADGDLVLVSKPNHVSIGILKTALAVNADQTLQRVVSIDLGATSGTIGLNADDGGRTSCSTRDSLLAANVVRIKQVIMRLDESAGSSTYGNLLMGVKTTAAGAMVWSPIIPDVDDLQFQFELAKIDSVTEVGSFCTSDTSNLWTGGTIASCGGPLNRDSTSGNVIRVLGLRAAFSVRSRIESEMFSRPTPLLFDRTGPTGSDKRLRRTLNMFLGTPNAVQ